jgi:hypothetical protein
MVTQLEGVVLEVDPILESYFIDGGVVGHVADANYWVAVAG